MTSLSVSLAHSPACDDVMLFTLATRCSAACLTWRRCTDTGCQSRQVHLEANHTASTLNTAKLGLSSSRSTAHHTYRQWERVAILLLAGINCCTNHSAVERLDERSKVRLGSVDNCMKTNVTKYTDYSHPDGAVKMWNEKCGMQNDMPYRRVQWRYTNGTAT